MALSRLLNDKDDDMDEGYDGAYDIHDEMNDGSDDGDKDAPYDCDDAFFKDLKVAGGHVDFGDGECLDVVEGCVLFIPIFDWIACVNMRQMTTLMIPFL